MGRQRMGKRIIEVPLDGEQMVLVEVDDEDFYQGGDALAPVANVDEMLARAGGSVRSAIPNRRVRRAAVGLYPLDVVVLVDPDGDRSLPFECRINCEEIADVNVDHGEIGDVLTIGFLHLQAELGALRNSS